MTIPRSAELQVSEDALRFTLVAMVGGSPGMVASYLLERFDIMAGEATIRRHDQEDFFF